MTEGRAESLLVSQRRSGLLGLALPWASRGEGTGRVCGLGARGAYDSWGLVPHDGVWGRVRSVIGPPGHSGLSDLVHSRTCGARM